MLEINLFAVKKEIVNNFLANLQATGIEVSGIQIAPLALYNFVMYDQQPASPWTKTRQRPPGLDGESST